MKKLNKKGFTLIELLAVIVIMGILMMVAIPAMQRYITNSRKDTYVNTLKEVVNVVRNADAAGYLENGGTVCNSGTYYVAFDTSTSGLLESGGKSPFTKGAITGYVKIATTSSGKTYSIAATDTQHGVSETAVESLNRGDVDKNGTAITTATVPTGSTTCTISE